MRILYKPNQYAQQRQREKKRWIYPVLMAMEAQYMRNQGHEVYWDETPSKPLNKTIIHPANIDIRKLPNPDRVWTKAMDEKYQNNGNFKYLPGTYIQSASGCWWGKCTFCKTAREEKYIERSVMAVIEDIEICKSMGFREVFDDSGTFPIGKWLNHFCLNFKDIDIKLSCNMRAIDLDYEYLKSCGFRMMLFGMESANQMTLNAINKGINTDAVQYVIKASLSGIECHTAWMFGYPCESDDEAVRTLKLIHYLLKKGYSRTAQASFYTCKGQNSYDPHRRFVKKIYDVSRSPEFWFNQLRNIKNKDDIKYLWRSIKGGLNERFNISVG